MGGQSGENRIPIIRNIFSFWGEILSPERSEGERWGAKPTYNNVRRRSRRTPFNTPAVGNWYSAVGVEVAVWYLDNVRRRSRRTPFSLGPKVK